MKKKQHRKDKYGHIGLISVALCLSTILFFFIRNHLLTMNNYFIDVEDSEQVYEIIASEFLIGETTKTEIEDALYSGVFGNLDCNNFQYGGGSDISDSLIVCDALGSHNILFPRTYRITMGFQFQDNLFSEVEVQSFTYVP